MHNSSVAAAAAIFTTVFFVFFAGVDARDYTRKECIDCTMRYIDISPKDGRVDANEIDNARGHYLNLLERGLSDSTTKIMKNCDYDKDGFITESDMYRANTTCLAKQSRVNDYYGYICKRAEDEARKHGTRP